MLEIILGFCLIFLLLNFVVFLYCAMMIKKEIISLQHITKIKDNYFYLIWSIGTNYNQYDDVEYTKEFVQELVDLAVKGNNNDDESVFLKTLKQIKNTIFLWRNCKRV